MNALLSYMKSYIILFFVLTVLVSMAPGQTLPRYIRFFSRMILVFGLFYPLLGWLGDSDAFLEKIRYESFLQQLEEANLNAQKIAYIDNDSYVGKYEDAIGQDAAKMAEKQNFVVKEVTVEMTKDYEIERISMKIANAAEENVIIGKVTIGQEEPDSGENTDAYRQLKETLLAYYQLSEDQLELILT